MGRQYGFYIDTSRCSGCKACQAACNDKHDSAAGVLWRRVYEVSGGSWIQEGNSWKHNILAYNISMACNHCEDPVCAKVCPAKAIFKRKDGIVLIDEKKCIGCRYCEWACPYGSPQYDHDKGVMSKCTLCYDYIGDGRNPSCVDACPMRVLEFGEMNDLRKKYGEISEIHPLPDKNLTRPAIVIKPHKDSIRIKESNLKVNNKEEV
ncbi:MAG TPA: dimethylsulfoxide reductase subunit B [Melioribacteraceae bacterium]|nr:dimethylsulfoxide reductase subunit B [Melioribacteraceae bacterium]